MSGPAKWSLDSSPKAPGPQVWKESEVDEDGDVLPSETHTGTDPLGRAVGPAEDHKEIKKVFNEKGEKVLPPGAENRQPKKSARRSSAAKKNDDK